MKLRRRVAAAVLSAGMLAGIGAVTAPVAEAAGPPAVLTYTPGCGLHDYWPGFWDDPRYYYQFITIWTVHANTEDHLFAKTWRIWPYVENTYVRTGCPVS